jgi:hypothetical protein
MRKLTALVLAGALMASMTPAQAKEPGWRKAECRYQYVDGRAGWSTVEVRYTIRCSAEKFGVSVTTAMYVANRESGFHQYAWNHSGCGGAGCLGIFQHHAAYWPGRVHLIPDKFKPYGSSAFNARTNILVTMAMVRQGGWSPWGL